MNNYLDKIYNYCENLPVFFHHVSGGTNPADLVTRPTSHKILACSKFLEGPPSQIFDENSLSFLVPCKSEFTHLTGVSTYICLEVFDFSKFSSFRKLCKVVHFSLKFINNLKSKVKARKSELFPSFEEKPGSYKDTCLLILRAVQYAHYQDILAYFEHPSGEVPALIEQLNLVKDSDGLLRVKGKMRNLKLRSDSKFPLLLHKNSAITSSIVNDYHLSLKHAGVYRLLSSLRREFWIPAAFQTVKKLISKCLVCKKLYGRSIKINQNDYKCDRINASDVPYRDIALDHIGPFHVLDAKNCFQKVYILIITCLWSRAVNLLVSSKIDSYSFLLSFQKHVFDFGIPQSLLADNGSPIVASFRQISTFLDDANVKDFLTLNNIKLLRFNPYPAHASHLGGTVESLVKLVKNMIYSSISRTKLSIEDFSYLVHEVMMLTNKRPLSFHRATDEPSSDIFPLTPEMLLRGYEVPCISVVPHLFCESDSLDIPYSEVIGSEKILIETFKNLRAVRKRLSDHYYDEFLANLLNSSTDRASRYKKVNHVRLQVGDLVAIKQKFTKPYFYPIGLVEQIEPNDIDEVVSVSIRKGNRETVRRHVSDLILLERGSPSCSEALQSETPVVSSVAPRPRRRAAETCVEKLKQHFA